MHNAIDQLLKVSLLIIGALFPIVNGPDNIPIFLALTTDVSNENRAVLARLLPVDHASDRGSGVDFRGDRGGRKPAARKRTSLDSIPGCVLGMRHHRSHHLFDVSFRPGADDRPELALVPATFSLAGSLRI